MIRSSCSRLSLTMGSAGSAESRRRIASSAGTLAAGSCGLNVAIASSIDRPISAPPGTRFHVVSTPSRMSFVAGSPPSSRKGSIREPRPGGPPMPKPCVLCMPRLRAAIDANDSPDTGSWPSTSIFTTPGPSGTFAGEPATAMPAPDSPRRRPGRRCGECVAVARAQLAELFGKCRGVAGEPEGFDGEHGGRGVMTVRGRGLRGEPRDDHVRAELADHAHDVAEDGLPVPDRSASPR